MYTAYLSTGEIMETDNFKWLYKNVRFSIRLNAATNAAIFFADGELIGAYLYLFKHDCAFHGDKAKSIFPLLKMVFCADEYGAILWNEMEGDDKT